MPLDCTEQSKAYVGLIADVGEHQLACTDNRKQTGAGCEHFKGPQTAHMPALASCCQDLASICLQITLHLHQATDSPDDNML